MQVINETELNSLYRFINQYDLIEICKMHNGVNEKKFCVDGIVTFRRNPLDIGFTRTFADTIIPEQYVSSVEREKEIVIHCGEDDYALHLVHEKPEAQSTTLSDSISLDELMKTTYLDEANVQINESTVMIPVSLHKLGILTRRQSVQIKRLLNERLDGAQVKYQCCRVPAFSVCFSDDSYTVYAHIYDLASHTYLNRAIMYDSMEDFQKIEPYKEFVAYASSFRS